MEALELEGALLQRSLNEGRKLLKERDDLKKEVQVLNDRIKDLEAEKCKLEIQNDNLLFRQYCVQKDMFDIKENIKTISVLYGQSEMSTERLLLEINTLKKENEDLKKQLASRKEHTP